MSYHHCKRFHSWPPSGARCEGWRVAGRLVWVFGLVDFGQSIADWAAVAGPGADI